MCCVDIKITRIIPLKSVISSIFLLSVGGLNVSQYLVFDLMNLFEMLISNLTFMFGFLTPITGQSSFQPSLWVTPWPRGSKPPFCSPLRRGNRRITPKLCVKSSSTRLTQRYLCFKVALIGNRASHRCKKRGIQRHFCCTTGGPWLQKTSRCQLSTVRRG